jgi:hypothetical protein
LAQYLNLPEYLRARLEHLKGVKTAEQIAREIGYDKAKMIERFAREIGYDKAKMIERFAAGEARVPIDKLLPLANALGAPLLPIFQLGMLQFGSEFSELAEAICNRVAVAGHSLADPTFKLNDEDREEAATDALDKPGEPPDPELDAYGPIYTDLCFDVPSEFRREFRSEAIARRLSYNELLLLGFATYRAYRSPPTRNAQTLGARAPERGPRSRAEAPAISLPLSALGSARSPRPWQGFSQAIRSLPASDRRQSHQPSTIVRRTKLWLRILPTSCSTPRFPNTFSPASRNWKAGRRCAKSPRRPGFIAQPK